MQKRGRFMNKREHKMAGRHAVSVPPLAFKRREDRHTTVVGDAAVLAARTRAAAAAALEGRARCKFRANAT